MLIAFPQLDPTQEVDPTGKTSLSRSPFPVRSVSAVTRFPSRIEIESMPDYPSGRWQLLVLRLLDLIVPATVGGLNNVNVVTILARIGHS